MVGFAESVIVFDVDNRSRELPLHPNGKFYDAKDYQDDNLCSESLHLSETEDDPLFMDAYSDVPMGDGFENVMSFSALNKSSGDLWDNSLGSFASEGSASLSQFRDTQSAADTSYLTPMESSITLQALPNLVDVSKSDGGGSEDSLGKDELEEENPNRQFAKQLGQTVMLQGGMYFAVDPLMRLGKRLFRSEGNEEDVVEDAGAAQVMVNRSGQIQHGMLNRGGDISGFAQAGAHESSRNMAGAFVLQKDVTTQVMKQAMIQAAQSAGASIGQGAATMTIAASAGAAAGGATAVAAGGAAAAATMSAKFAIGVVLTSVIAAGGLGGATLGSYMGEEELKINVPKPIFAQNDLGSYKFDIVDQAVGIGPTVSPDSFYEDLGSLGFQPTASPGVDLSYGDDASKPLTSSPFSAPITGEHWDAVESPSKSPTSGAISIPVNTISGSPFYSNGGTLSPDSSLAPGSITSTMPITLPIAASTEIPTAFLISSPAVGTVLTPSPAASPSDTTTATPTITTFFTNPTAVPSGSTVLTSNPSTGSIGTVSVSPTEAIGGPTTIPELDPSTGPTGSPFINPTAEPIISSPAPSQNILMDWQSALPSMNPTKVPSVPSTVATDGPSSVPSPGPTSTPTIGPTSSPKVFTNYPSSVPSQAPTTSPTSTVTPTTETKRPSLSPSSNPTKVPSAPSSPPSVAVTGGPSSVPSPAPTFTPTIGPTSKPSPLPSPTPSAIPTSFPTSNPTDHPSPLPSPTPTFVPTGAPVVAPVPIAPQPIPVAPTPTEAQPVPVAPVPLAPQPAPVPVAPQPVVVAPAPVVAPVPIAPQPVVVVPAPVVAPVPTAAPITLPVGTITGWSLVSGSGSILIASLQEGQTINTATYGTNLKVRALYSTVAGPVNSVSFAITNNSGGGSSNIWSKVAPFYETDNSFLKYASVNIKGTPLPSSTNQGSKGPVAEINLVIVGTIP